VSAGPSLSPNLYDCLVWFVFSVVGQDRTYLGRPAEEGQNAIRISRCPGVDVVGTSQPRSPDHCSVASRASRQRALETEAPVGTIGVVVVDELGEVGMEVSFVDDHDVVEHLRA
jgi:hypothetical protein